MTLENCLAAVFFIFMQSLHSSDVKICRISLLHIIAYHCIPLEQVKIPAKSRNNKTVT